MKEASYPMELKAGSVAVKVYRVQNGARTRYTVVHYEGEDRKIRQFTEEHRARTEAKATANRLNAGKGAPLELTGPTRDAVAHALDRLRPTGLSLTVAVDEFLKARSFNVPVVEACRLYAETHHKKLPVRTVSQVYAEFLQAKEKDGASAAYLHDLKMRCGPFAKRFAMPIADIQTADIDDYLRNLKVAPRSRNNARRAIATLFNFAKASGCLDRDRASAAEHTASAREKVEAISTFSPSEMAKLLGAADDVVLPWFALAAFAGLRTAEVQRLRWEDIRWAEKVVEIRAAVAKTRRRRLAPLTPAALGWLARWKGQSGPVLLPGVRIDEKVRGVAKRAGVEWRRNAMRHSFITYRLAELRDHVRVAFEAGNSPVMVRSNYDAVATPREAKKWFALRPGKPANVVEMAVASA